jgi:hypothetical protein
LVELLWWFMQGTSWAVSCDPKIVEQTFNPQVNLQIAETALQSLNAIQMDRETGLQSVSKSSLELNRQLLNVITILLRDYKV